MLDRLYIYLSGIRPIAILLTYVGLIPVFAIIFCLLPGQQFYAPFARLEPIAAGDAKQVENNITAAMAESYRGHESLADGWQIARSDLETHDLTTDASNGLTFTVYYFALKHEGGKITASVGGPEFTARLSQQRIVTHLGPNQMVCHIVTLPENSAEGPATFNQRLLFRPTDAVLQADAVCWGYREESALQNLVAGWSGDPRRLSGFVGRMAYFSATTMTTVGFGDIVPITGTSRFLTALEPIAGWLLAGLFLNSIAGRVTRDRSY